MIHDVHGVLNPGLPSQKAVCNNTKTLFTSKSDLSMKKKRAKCYFRSLAFYDSVTWALGKVDQRYIDSLEMRCWRIVEMISGTDCR